jgi:PAS domain S-box-containing protein
MTLLPQLLTTREAHLTSTLVAKITDFAIFMLTPDGIVATWNAGAQRTKGYLAEEIIGRPFTCFYTEEDRQAGVPQRALATARETGIFESIGWRVKKDGSRFWAHVVIDPLYDDDGTLLGFGKVTRDVTAAREAKERETRAKEALLRERTEQSRHLLRLFEQAPGFVCFFRGPEHVYELQNEAHHRLAGYRDIIGKPVREALPELAGQGFFELLDGVFRSGQPYVGRALPLRVEGPDGARPERYIDFVYQPIFDDDGRVVGVFSQGNDVTEQVHGATVLAEKQRELERTIGERTAALAELQTTQAALQHSQKLEAIGKLTGGVAHDFNNILQVIGGNLQLLKDAPGEMDGKRLDAAVAAVQRGAKLAAQLLAFARRQPLQPRVVNPARVLQQMDELLRRALGETVEVETIGSAGLWNTMVDPYQLENVLLNLAINARDAMPGGGKLTIELGNAMLDDEYVAADHDLTPGQYVMFAISDNGTGMTKEVLERACEPFFSTKPEGQGTGLGLSMAYGFAKQSGGHFKLYSEVGHGTTVKMYFPRSYKAEAVEAPQAGQGKPVGGTETILVVEDDAAVQATVVQMLSSLGYRVMKADNAANALAILNSGLPIDLLFTDVVMPGEMRSPELARQARLIHPDIEVLFTSGYTQNAIVHDGKLDAGVQLLSKPYGRDQLARKVRQMLAKEGRPAPEEPAPAPVAARWRILFVEDDPDILATSCMLLEGLKQKVDGAGSPGEALHLLERNGYDLLISDYELPGMNGAELIRHARTVRPGLRAVLCSGFGMVEEARELGVATLNKPFVLDDLKKILEAGPAA